MLLENHQTSEKEEKQNQQDACTAPKATGLLSCLQMKIVRFRNDLK